MAKYSEKIINIRTRAFGGRLETVSATVDADGTVRVLDSVAGYYTTCHTMPASAVTRVRRSAAI